MTPEERAKVAVAEWAMSYEANKDAHSKCLDDLVAQVIRDAVAEEREACARIAATMGGDFIEADAHGDGYVEARKHIASAIRSRANEKEKTG